ncbi:MAG: UvrABC system protein A [Patescibacteria group bacterium]|nr:MAG: UvrABC system protein A [Patescibacteria group bacterium]
MIDKIKITGAREHNLKNVDLEIPKNTFTVITGVSGSGKSSLAFDTIYAEGQRRYIQSLSAYARQFLGISSKPDVDFVEGLSPAISIDQKKSGHNPRSTVGTVTEIYDYLRLLFSKVGDVYCPNCDKLVSKLTVQEILKIILEKIKELKNDTVNLRILSPIINQKKGEFKSLMENLISKGFNNAIIDGTNYELRADNLPDLNKNLRHSIKTVIDFLSINKKNLSDEVFLSNLKTRLNSDIENAVELSEGIVEVEINNKSYTFSEKFTCQICGWSVPEIEPRIFSFNSPIGACKTCKGLGTIYKINPEKIINPKLSINEGGLLAMPNLYEQDTWYARLIKTVAKEEGINLNTPLKDIPEEKLNMLLYGTKKNYTVFGKNRFGKTTFITEKFNGIIPDLEAKFFEGDGDIESHHLSKYFYEDICPDCQGKRLNKTALSIRINNKNIAEISSMTISNILRYFKTELIGSLDQFETEISKLIIKEIESRLQFLNDVGLSYLTLDRKANTLSGGESQRIRLASQLGTGLTGVLYVLDEPSIGLHPSDVSALIKSLKYLRDLGNTLIVVEHDKETMLSADYIVEMGPGSGEHGGKVVFSGYLDNYRTSKTLTTKYLFNGNQIRIPQEKLSLKKGFLRLKGVKHNNLKNIDIEIPLSNFIVVTGVSGSGKSSLIADTLYPALKYYIDGYFSNQIGEFATLEGYEQIKKVYLVDQSSIGRTPRSNTATYIGFFNEIRDLFAETQTAKLKGFTKSRFSFNLKGGRCERCEGAGEIKIEMQFLADVYVKCPVCKGKRYNEETLTVTYKGLNIYEVLNMTVEEGLEFFRSHKKIYEQLKTLDEVGLSYIKLGQSAPTFSGGESQRLKIASELSKKNNQHTVYILDEPTTGLHFADIQKLLNSLYKLVKEGNTVIVIEHNIDVIKNAQYIIELGPEGGEKGGYLLYQGQLSGLKKVKNSPTAKYLF